MRNNSFKFIQTKLKDITEGTYITHKTNTLMSDRTTECLSSKHTNKGKGFIDEYYIFPGITLSYQYFLGDEIDFHHDAIHSSLEINHCNLGRIGIHMKDDQKVFLGEGDMALQPMDCCANADITLPLGFYEGIIITIDLNELSNNPPDLLDTDNAFGAVLLNKFCKTERAITIPANHRIEHIFCEIYQVPSDYKISYMKLKVIELILFLCLLKPEEEMILSSYQSDQVEIIKKIHQQLVDHLDQRYTIEEISSKYLMNPTTLKNTFKNVYGLPIASYMKKYRINVAATLLRETTDSIAVIASKVGYESQGKFTKAFKEHQGMSPSDYRKQY